MCIHSVRKPFVVFALLLIALTLPLSSALEAQDNNLTLNDLIISATPEDELRPQVAYSFGANVYLVIWQDETDVAPTTLYGRYVFSNGQPSGESFVIATGLPGKAETKVFYGGGVFLLLWRQGEDIYSGSLFLQRLEGLPSDTPLIGPPVLTHEPIGQQFSALYDRTSSDFLVIWFDRRHPVLNPLLRGEIYGRRVSTEGSLLGEEVNLTPVSTTPDITEQLAAPAVQGEISIAHNRDAQEYLLTYCTYWCTSISCVIREEVYAQRIDASTLSPFGGFIRVTPGTSRIQWAARVVYNPDEQEYLVVWADNRWAEDNFDLYGQRISPAGSLIGTNFFIVAGIGSQTEPEIAYLPGEPPKPRYALVWQEEQAGTTTLTWGLYLSGSGEPQDGPFALSGQDSAFQRFPQLVTDGKPSPSFLAVWEHTLPYGNADIHGQILPIVLLPLVDLISPVHWARVLSLRPTFRWGTVAGADRYLLTLYRATESEELGESYPPLVLGAESTRDPENPETHFYKLEFELTSGASLSTGGYLWGLKALDQDGNTLAESLIAPFQIPALGPPWERVKDQVCSSFCDGSAPNPYWYQYDDAIYAWSEVWDLPPMLLKAIMIGESSSGLGQRTLDDKQFPPHRAYLYEPGWDYIIHFTPEYPNPEPELDPFRVPAKPPSSDQCDLDGTGPCPFPYDRVVEGAPTIYEYSWLSTLGGRFSNNYGAGKPLTSLEGCSDPENPGKCVAAKPGRTAQYRLVASYGLGQIVYVFQHEDLRELEGLDDELVPELLYGPDLGTKYMAFHLAKKRCIEAPLLGAEDTDLELWRFVLLAYNGGGNPNYDDTVIAREDFVQPHSLVPYPTSIVLETKGHDCPLIIETPQAPNSFAKLLSEVATDENEVASGEVDLRGDGSTVWLTLSTLEDPSSGRLDGLIRLYDDETQQTLVWQSPPLEDVGSGAVFRLVSVLDRPLLLVDWFTGPHATRTYLVQWDGTQFLLVPTFDLEGEPSDGIGSDGGGVYVFPDGSLVAFQKTYLAADQRAVGVYEYDTSGYYEQVQSYIVDENMEDTVTPQTSISITPEPNGAGWNQPPAYLFLMATDDTAVFLIEYTLVSGNETKSVASALSNISIPLGEGRWTLYFNARDIYGNVEETNTAEYFIDGTPPLTEVTVDGQQTPDGSYRSPVEISLSARDPDLVDGSPSSGVDRIEYRLHADDGWRVYEGPILITQEGTATVHFRAFDVAGNAEDAQILEISVVAFPLRSFVVLAHESAHLLPKCTVMSGDVGANLSRKYSHFSSTPEVIICPGVKMLDSAARVLGDTIVIMAGAQVHDVYYNELRGHGSILGDHHTPLELPLVPSFPQVPAFDPGSENKRVLWNSTVRLDEGRYGTLYAHRGAAITFSGGIYHFQAWNVGRDVTLYFEAPTEIRIAGKLYFGAGSYLGPAENKGTLDATDIVIYVNGKDRQHGRHFRAHASRRVARFSHQSRVFANVYAPHGTLWFGRKSEATGAFLGKRVIVGAGTTLTLRSAWR